MSTEPWTPAELVREIKAAAAHMRDVAAAVTGGAPFLAALAEHLDAETNVRHMPIGVRPRGILGGFNVNCSCGSDWVDDEGRRSRPCRRLERLRGVAAAYGPSLIEAREVTDEPR